ncbi:hypothetical protein OG563_38450 [Nocardia vinacea]|uniref:Uncharacterized protein n=1 Tax=Nocardia vinacea TaxID=96468 RepID=A0ABZ1YPN8_9NOCA|nr:hypothetical protein [Nocardia vinacea]
MTGSSIGGGVSAITDVTGDVKIRRGSPAGTPPPPPSSASSLPGVQADQSVTNSRVAGSVDRVSRAGSVEIDE